MAETQTRDVESSITEGGLLRPLLELAWPMVVFQLLQVAYNITDTLWLGRYSADAVGALSIAFPLIFLFISMAGGFNTAGSILVAQYKGAEGKEAAQAEEESEEEGSAAKAAGQTVSFVGALSIVLGAFGFVATGPLLGLIPSSAATTQQVIPLAEDYMRVFFLGLPFLFGFFMFSALLRGYGNTRTPMRVMGISVALNLVLDPMLIFGWGPVPQLGMTGAAIATVLARVVAAGLGFYVLFGTNTGPNVSLAHLSPDTEIIKKIIRVGVPSMAEQSTSALAMITLTAMVVTFPPAVVTAYGLGNRLGSVIFLPALGLGRATNTIVGQNLGAEQPDRAESAVWLAAKIAAGVLFVAAIVAALAAKPIVGVFMATGTEQAAQTIELGSEYLRIRSIEFVFMGLLQVMLGAYRGAGSTKTAMIFSMVTLWLGRVPTIYFLAFQTSLGATGIWIGMAAGNVLGGIAATLWFTRGTWKEAVIEKAEPVPD